MLDDIEKIFKGVRGFGESSRALVTLATVTGALLLVFYIVKFLVHLITGEYASKRRRHDEQSFASNQQ